MRLICKNTITLYNEINSVNICFIKYNIVILRLQNTLDMKQQRKVIHVELKEPYKGKRHYYFGSITAIYELLPTEVVGCSKETLWNVLRNDEHKGRKAIIRYGTLHTKQSNRGIRKEANNG